MMLVERNLMNLPRIIEEHWSQKNHPLEHLTFTLSENDCDDNDGDRSVLECNGSFNI